MKITIKDVKPDGSQSRIYYSIDNDSTESMLVDKQDVVSLATLTNAIKSSLKGTEYIGETFEI